MGQDANAEATGAADKAQADVAKNLEILREKASANRDEIKLRAWARFEIKSVEAPPENPDGPLTLEGIASTPTTDRMGDIVEPLGARFELPLPLLWQHYSDKPIGSVTFAKPTAKGIPFRAEVARAGVTDYIDEARAILRERLVRGVSIGFRSIESEPVEEDDVSFFAPLRFKEWEWLELSTVTIPANVEATINTIKSLDKPLLRAAFGAQRSPAATTSTPPGASGRKSSGAIMPTVAEQISSYENKRAANAARIQAIMAESFKDGRTLTTEEADEHDKLEVEIKQIDEHLRRLKAHQATLATTATAVDSKANGGGGASAADVSDKGGGHASGVITLGRSNLPKGTAFTRFFLLFCRAKGNYMQAWEWAKNDPYFSNTPEVAKVFESFVRGGITKAAVAPGTTTDTTWAGPLVQLRPLAAEFIEFLYPMTILGRMTGLRRIPFNVKIPRQTSMNSSQWVGQTKAKPVGKVDFDFVSLGFAKVSTINVVSEELVRFSDPSVEAILQRDLAEAIAKFLDIAFADPTITAVVNVSPASISNGALTVPASGATIDSVTTDANALIGELTSHDVSMAGAYWLMNPRTAQAIGSLRTTQGVFAFPGLNMAGGEFWGLPVLTSNNIALKTDTAKHAYALLVQPGEVLLADDGGVDINISNEASLAMDSAPADGPTQLVSMYQQNLVAIRAERYINWALRHAHAVAVWSNLTL